MSQAEDKELILIVDDAPDNIDVLASVLRDDYEIKAATSGAKALRIAASSPSPDMILLDIMMAGMDGYEVCRQLKANPATSEIPVIFISARSRVEDEKRGLELGAVDFIAKPISPPIVKARVKTHLAMHDQRRVLAREVRKKTSELRSTRLKIVQRLGRAAEYKDSETGLHIIRMSHYARLIAEAYGGNEDWVELVFNAAPMHDIGKIGIPDSVLGNPGKLSPEQWEIMKSHTEIGAHIIGDDPDPLLRMARTIALTHHEKWNGTGYPRGLKGEDIPIEGRITAIADVFDALTSPRPYKRAWTIYDSVALIREHAGLHFDPHMVELFDKALPEILRVREKYSDPV
ncbi:MAG: two-component system response regulator [Chromatiales bacterium]|nr:two-component system response regulator [Gammaproteobacteria bacterium]MCP5352848.1 two-component system response regulator [Chromatiales bacterium]